ncbi:MAG: hypothetical protein KBF71_06845 [Alphaproteobacteria bacterium]|jgi:hypothetical protein|nr:hypothetical protein [Alphaproteobacteria bacterium]
MAVDNVSNQPPLLSPLSSASQTENTAMTLGNLSGMGELKIITMITVAVSKVINTACSGPFQQLINNNQHQQYLDQAWEAAINAAVNSATDAANSSASASGDSTPDDSSITVTLPSSVTLADGTTSTLQEYLAERPDLASTLYGTQVEFAENAVSTLSGNTIGSSDYINNLTYITNLISQYGDISQLPKPAPPLPSMSKYPSNAPLPQIYVDYANKLAAFFTSQNITTNQNFLFPKGSQTTADKAKSLSTAISASGTNFMTAVQQLINTLNNLISALATFCAAMAKCQQAVLSAPGSGSS